MMFGRVALFGRDYNNENNESWAVLGAGLVAGLSTGYISTTWFSAVEGEVYSMSTMFTTMTMWAAMKWYYLEDNPKNDKWLIFCSLCCRSFNRGAFTFLIGISNHCDFYIITNAIRNTAGWVCLSPTFAGIVAIFLFQILIITEFQISGFFTKSFVSILWNAFHFD